MFEEEEIEFVDADSDDIWSSSKIKTIESCGKQFYFKYRTKQQGVQTPYLAFGKAVHRVIELVHQANEWTEPWVLELWNDTWFENTIDVDFTGYYKPQFLDTGAKMLRKYIKKNKAAKVLELESPFPTEKEVYKIGRFVMRGIIDQVRRMDDGRLLIVDFKTSKYPPDPLILRADPQFTIYWDVARQKYPNENPLLALYHLESGKMFFTERTTNDVALVESIILQGQAKINQKMFERNIGINCRYCPFIQDCLGALGEHVTENNRGT